MTLKENSNQPSINADSESALNSTFVSSDNAAIKKKRGAPKGVLRGPRPTYFIGAAVDLKNNLLLKQIQISLDEDNFNLDEIKELWEQEYGIKPEYILGPFYEKKSLSTSSSNCNSFLKSKDTSDLSLTSLTFTGERKFGEYNGWEVTVQLLKEPEGYGWILFRNEIGEEDSKKKQKPPSKAVKLNQINNLRDNF